MKEIPFLCIVVTLATLRDVEKIPHSNDQLTSFAKVILTVLPSTFNTFV